MKIFISHSSYDKWIARQLSSQLTDRGHETFLDEKDIDTGDSIYDSLQTHLADCDELLILISPVSLKSHWVFIEIGGAKALGKRIVPLLFHVEANEIPQPISQLLARDINEIEKYYAELDQRTSGKAAPKYKKTPSRKKNGDFAVGDRVRIADVEHLTDDDKQKSPKWVEGMDKYSGAVAEIVKIKTPDNVRLSVDDNKYWWSVRWFTKAD